MQPLKIPPQDQDQRRDNTADNAGNAAWPGVFYLVSLKPLKLPVATNMARLTGAAIDRHRRYVMAISATSPLAFMAVPHKATLVAGAQALTSGYFVCALQVFADDALRVTVNNAIDSQPWHTSKVWCVQAAQLL